MASITCHPLALQGDGPIVNEGLEGLPVFSLKHHFKLFPAGLVVISSLGINIEGLQVVNGPGVECSPVLRLLGCVEAELWGFPAWGGTVGCHCNWGNE